MNGLVRVAVTTICCTVPLPLSQSFAHVSVGNGQERRLQPVLFRIARFDRGLPIAPRPALQCAQAPCQAPPSWCGPDCRLGVGFGYGY